MNITFLRITESNKLYLTADRRDWYCYQGNISKRKIDKKCRIAIVELLRWQETLEWAGTTRILLCLYICEIWVLQRTWDSIDYHMKYELTSIVWLLYIQSTSSCLWWLWRVLTPSIGTYLVLEDIKLLTSPASPFAGGTHVEKVSPSHIFQEEWKPHSQRVMDVQVWWEK